jgi:hypothetical protein
MIGMGEGLCYDERMIKASRDDAFDGMLVTAVEEVPRISDAERKKLKASLLRSRSEIMAGNYDRVTAKSLRADFDSALDEHGGQPLKKS